MDLFDYLDKTEIDNKAPLATRFRPERLDDILGQEHLTREPDGLIRVMLNNDMLRSIILYGASGTGKTTIASAIATETTSIFKSLNATNASKKDVELVVSEAIDNRKYYQKKTILFLDEIHRFNKAQQDYLLPFTEDGTVILIGATTENPFFEVNRALLSRTALMQVKPLEHGDIAKLIIKALTSIEHGLGSYKLEITDEALELLAKLSNGDARAALNNLEISAALARVQGLDTIDVQVIYKVQGKKLTSYDKRGNSHYDVISAFIKSVRGSNPQAALIYLAMMLEGGEDISFIARRIIILASEDIGNADPQALVVANNAAQAVERIGMPEARIILSQAVLYLATAPKSNAGYIAIDKALDFVRNNPIDVPGYLRDGHYSGARSLNNVGDYIYPHNYPRHYYPQEYMPKGSEKEVFYEPSENGYERVISQYLSYIDKIKREYKEFNKEGNSNE